MAKSEVTLPVLQRECGGCSACCVLLEIPELEKPADIPCEHCVVGGGCGIYAKRPAVCQEFRCLWLKGVGPLDARPDLSGVVIFQPAPNRLAPLLMAVVDPHRPEAWRLGPAADILEDWTSRGWLALVKVGEKMGVIGKNAAKVRAFRQGIM